MSAGSAPPTASRNAAVSRTLRVITCSTRFGSVIGRLDVRPRDGFSPTTPHHAAGSRIEPPMSLACATGTSPAATAAAAPPLDPAVERMVSHGLRHAPKAIGWVVGWQPNSGNAVLPTVTTPAARKRPPRMVSEGARQSSDRSSPLPMYSGRPARQAPTSLSRNGTPWNGPRGSAGSAAMARPMSGSGTTTAFSTGLAASMRAIALSASSAGVTSPSATRSRRATASSHPRSLADTGGAYAISARTPRPTGRRSAAGDLVLRCDVQRPRSPSIPWRGTTMCSTGLSQ